MNEFFTTGLKLWGKQNRRDLPWVGVRDAYKVWLSEVILQQTRVDQGLPYYKEFISSYPSVEALAEAEDDEVMKRWEGLGYYNRARNMLRTARRVATEFGGAFPASYEGLRSLPGVGEYTAAAVASFAFGLPYAVVDGNVYRLLSRFFCLDRNVNSTEGKRAFAELAQNLLDQRDPGTWNQTVMDFGSRQCKPKNPDCPNCPLASRCLALKEGRVDLLPVKNRKAVRRSRYFHYLVFDNGGKTILRKRTEKDIWPDLYEFPQIEHGRKMSKTALASEPAFRGWLSELDCSVEYWSPWFKQQLSHQDIHARFVRLRVTGGQLLEGPEILEIERDLIRNFAFPRIIRRYLALE